MKYIIIFFCSIILPMFSLTEIKPKLCINCKYCIKNINDNKFSKCSLFPDSIGEINFLVAGINEDKYYSCFASRSIHKLCGEEGKMYKENGMNETNV